MDNLKYCEDFRTYKRRPTREVKIGQVSIGGECPLALQSMTNRRPMETDANVEQIIRIADAGGDIVRLTAPTVKDAANLAKIRKALNDRYYHLPLVADIHFNPGAALEAAKHVEKVRINPGNFAEVSPTKVDYTDEEYREALAHAKEKFRPLVKYCKAHGLALRVGSNHGSLSQRIMSRYGDTPQGMVEAAIEYLKMAMEMDFYDIVISMKSSNIRVMVQAYRYLSYRMEQEGMAFPLHLGVTEAGSEEDGIIKSAAGNGALLYDGLGDTLRVSLTDEPENEIPIARLISDYAAGFAQGTPVPAFEQLPYHPFEFRRRHSTAVKTIGGKNYPVVVNHDLDINRADMADASKPGFVERLSAKPTFIKLKITHWLKYAEQLKQLSYTPVLIVESDNPWWYGEIRALFSLLQAEGLNWPVLPFKTYHDSHKQAFMVKAAMDMGPLLIDGLADGLWIEAPALSRDEVQHFALSLLQAARSRFSKADFISCPGCGRTLFDLQEATGRIKTATGHLKGVKIGIMGCIVNGPGEMADADYGYVGAGKGKINLYKGKQVVRKQIDEALAVDELIGLIKENGDWQEPVNGD